MLPVQVSASSDQCRVSADPGMKGWIGVARNYASVETGATMKAFSVGVVVESNHPDVRGGRRHNRQHRLGRVRDRRSGLPHISKG